jgi:hypothetical protein
LKTYVAKYTALREGNEASGKMEFFATDDTEARTRAGALVQIALYACKIYVADEDIHVQSVRRKFWFTPWR